MRGLVIAALLGSAGTAFAQTTPFVPVGLPHQGRLLDLGDRPVNGRLMVTFALYKQDQGGQPVWQESRQVDFDDGYYTLHLGTQTDPANPIDPALFANQLYLGIKVASGNEMQPRLRIGTVPYALRAELANSMKGGTIQGATITGSDIDATGLKINGSAVIDADGKYLGVSTNALNLGGQPANAFATKAESDTKYFPRAGGQVAGDLQTQGALTATGAVSGSTLSSTATTGAPLTVASSDMVANLNAEMVGGRKASDFTPLQAFVEHDFSNRVLNGSFERGADGQLPTYFEAAGPGTNGARALTAGGRYGAKALTITDNDLNATLAVKQVLVPAPQGAAYARMSFTASVWAKRVQGPAQLRGQICITDAGADGQEPQGSIDCADLTDQADWARTSVTHTVSEGAQYVAVVLSATKQPAEAGTYAFDGLMVSVGEAAPPFVAHVTEQLYDNGIPASKLIQGAGSGLDADKLDGLDSAKFLRSDVDTTSAGKLTVGGATALNSTLTVGGATTINANTTINGTHAVNGAQSVSGNASVGGTFSAGASTLASASVTGNATVGGTLTVSGNATMNGNLTLAGALTAGAFNGAWVPRYQDWNSKGTGDGGASIYNDANVYKALVLTGNNSAGGNRRIHMWDDVTVNNNFTVNKDAGVGGNLTVNGRLSAGAMGSTCVTVNGDCGAGMYNQPTYYFDRVGGGCGDGYYLRSFHFYRCGTLGTASEGLMIQSVCCR